MVTKNEILYPEKIPKEQTDLMKAASRKTIAYDICSDDLHYR